MTTTDPRRVPHTGPGHASGDPGWCEGCAAEFAADRAEREARAESATDPRARLDEIKARADAATEGPWDSEYDNDFYRHAVFAVDSGPGTAYIAEDLSQGENDGEEDAEFIAHARTDVPWLIEYARQRDATLTAVLDVLDNGSWEQDVHDLAADVDVVAVDDVRRAITEKLKEIDDVRADES